MPEDLPWKEAGDETVDSVDSRISDNGAMGGMNGAIGGATEILTFSVRVRRTTQEYTLELELTNLGGDCRGMDGPCN